MICTEDGDLLRRSAMPPRGFYGKQMTLRAINQDGTYGEPIEFIEPFLIEEEPVETEPLNEMTLHYLNNTTTTFSGTLILPHKKMSSKTFKKWLMSRGFNRDLAEWFCNVVKSFHGEKSYQSLYFNGLFSSTPQDLVNILFDTLFPIPDLTYTNNKETEK